MGKFDYTPRGHDLARKWLDQMNEEGRLYGLSLKLYKWATSPQSDGFGCVLAANSIHKKMLIKDEGK